MKAERLFRVLGLASPALVEEAITVPPRNRTAWKRWGALAACLALAAGLGLGGFWPRLGGGPGEPGDSGSGGSGVENGVTFMSYAGPVFPLTTLEAPAGLTAERTVTWDFAGDVCPDGSPRQWGAEVTDSYVLYNSTDTEITATALYPFAGDFDSFGDIHPSVTAGGETVETVLYAGAYSGGFQSTFGAELPDTMNLDTLNSWTEYQVLLESGEYQAQALEACPALDIPVIVYEFSDFAAPLASYPAATQAISFHLSPEETQIFTYGFNGMDQDGTFRRYSYFVPDGMRNEPDLKILAVLGKDLEDYTLQGYQDGGCEAGEEIDGVSCSITRRETTMDDLLDQLCRYYRARYMDMYSRQDVSQAVPFHLYRGAAAQLLAGYGPLSPTPADRYGDGRLDDILAETMNQDRVLYLAFPVTVAAGERLRVTCSFWKAPSFDYACSGSEHTDLQGYDLVTRLGSTLDFTVQRAALVNAGGLELAGQNFGFDLKDGAASAELSPEQEHYYLEIRVKER